MGVPTLRHREEPEGRRGDPGAVCAVGCRSAGPPAAGGGVLDSWIATSPRAATRGSLLAMTALKRAPTLAALQRLRRRLLVIRGRIANTTGQMVGIEDFDANAPRIGLPDRRAQSAGFRLPDAEPRAHEGSTGAGSPNRLQSRRLPVSPATQTSVGELQGRSSRRRDARRRQAPLKTAEPRPPPRQPPYSPDLPGEVAGLDVAVGAVVRVGVGEGHESSGGQECSHRICPQKR